MVNAPGTAREAGASGNGSAVKRRATPRQVYLDNLKVVVIAAIITMHGVLGYAGMVDTWLYTGVREVTLSPATEAVLFVGGRRAQARTQTRQRRGVDGASEALSLHQR